MTMNELKNTLNNYKKGTYVKVEWVKPITLKNGKLVTKKSSSVIRLGINYGNLQSVKDRESSQQNVTEKQPTEWLIKNFVKLTTTGKQVLMAYTTKKHKTITEWLDENNCIISKCDIEDLLYAKDKLKSNSQLDLFTLNIDNIVSINR